MNIQQLKEVAAIAAQLDALSILSEDLVKISRPFETIDVTVNPTITLGPHGSPCRMSASVLQAGLDAMRQRVLDDLRRRGVDV